jgi:hypothetical protein
MAQTRYLRTTSGAACGPGDRESLSLTDGNTPASKVLDATGDTWNVTLPDGGVLTGAWSVVADIEVDAGAGGDEITCTVAVYDSACGFARHAVISAAVAVADGLTDLYTFGPVDPGEIRYHLGDVLRVVLAQTAGADACTLHYNGPVYDAALTHPNSFKSLPPQTGPQSGGDEAHVTHTGADFADPLSAGTEAARVTYKADDFVSVTQSGTDTAHRTAVADDFIERD